MATPRDVPADRCFFCTKPTLAADRCCPACRARKARQVDALILAALLRGLRPGPALALVQPPEMDLETRGADE